jgi:DNA repair exonuclease SbcCD ATPase subunit
MAKALFTQEKVFEVADSMAAEGKEVTALSLLSKLGGGGLTTIYRHMYAWRDQRQGEASPATAQTVPEPVQAAFASALGTVWRVAESVAGKEVVEAKEKAAEKVADANKKVEELLQIIEQMEEQAKADTAKIESLSVRVAELEAALQQSQNDASAYKATVDQLANQVRSLEVEQERLHGEIDKERTARQQEIQRITQAAEAEQQKAAQQIESLKAELSEAQGKAQQLAKEKDEAQSRRDETQRQLEKAEEASKADRVERDAAIKEAAQLRGLSEGLKTQNGELLSRIGRDDKARKGNPFSQ